MTLTEKILRFFLIASGATCVCALVFMVMPLSCMKAAHRLLGMGEMPVGPVVEYLARSVCALYAMLGGVMILSGLKLRPYRALVLYLGAVWIVFGAAAGVIDHAAGMPLFWTLGESLVTVAMGAVMFLLGLKIQKA